MNKTNARIGMAACVWLAAAIFTPSGSRAQTITYDPDSCASETNGKVFVRLASGLAFAFPAFDLLRLRDGPVKDPGPVADPSEPIGCPLNPILANGIVVAYEPVAPRAPAEPTDRRWRPNLVQIFSFKGPVTVQDGNLKLFTGACIEHPEGFQHGRVLEDMSLGLQECRGQFPDIQDGDGPSMLVAKPGKHPEHDGRRFAVQCWPAWTPGGSQTCDTSYAIEGGPSIMYRFQDGLVPPAHMLEFDLQVRAFIASRRAPEYDQEKSNGKP